MSHSVSRENQVLADIQSAGRLIGDQAQRAKLLKVDLPAAYRKLGKQLHAEGSLSAEYPDIFQTIKSLNDSLIGLDDEAEAASTEDSSGVAARAKNLADSAKRTTKRLAIHQKRDQAFGALGRAAYPNLESKSNLAELGQEVGSIRSRIEALEREIGELSQDRPEHFISPKRIAIGGTVMFAVVSLMILTFFVRGRSGERSAASNTLTATNTQPSIPSSKPLPNEYRVLAEQVALAMKAHPSEFRDNKGISEILSEGHSSIMALRGIQSSDPEITYIADQAESAFSQAFLRLERINALPKPPGMGELLAASFIDGFMGNVYGGYARGLEAEEKQKAILDEMYPLAAAIEKGDAAHQMLPKVAEKYSATIGYAGDEIVVDFDESWGWFGPHDWLSIYNGGPSRRDCTVIV